MTVPHASHRPPAPATLALAEWIEPATVFAGVPHEHAFWLDAGLDARSGWSWVGEGAPAARPDPDLGAGSRPDANDDADDDANGEADRDRVGGDVARWAGGPFRGGWVGWADYDTAAARAGAPARADPVGVEETWMRVERVVAFDHAERRVWLHAPHDEIAAFGQQVLRWQSAGSARVGEPAGTVAEVTAVAGHSPDEYAALIERCRSAIERGDAYQLCLTTRFSLPGGEAPVDAEAVFARLRAAASSHHGALIRSGATSLVSVSPERFLQLEATSGCSTVRTSPIKGTRARGADPHGDAALAAELAASPKERAENVMIVDLMRNDLQRICEPGSVSVESLLAVETYPTVHQLVSTVAGRLRPGIRLDDVLAATFPAGSMTGAPKLSAMSILHDLEGHPRGLFAGCFGWVGADGQADLAMVIRSIVVHPGGAYVGAGGGITWGSDAAAEVDEVALKARAPLAALGASLPPRWRERVR